MEKHIYDEKTGISYTLHGDYYLPDIKLAEEPRPRYGKFGMLRKTFLRQYKSGLYQSLLLQGKLVEHLNQIDSQANERMEILMEQMAEAQGVTEQLKAEDWLTWLRRMNNIQNSAEEIVLGEIVY